MLLTILLVCFVVVMLLWMLNLIGAVPLAGSAGQWLGFFACLILGIVVFLVGSGMIVVER